MNNSTTNAKRQASLAIISQTVKELLSGNPPKEIPADLGEFGDIVQELHHAYQQGGVKAVRRVWNSLIRMKPEIAELIAGDVERKTEWTAKELLRADFPEPRWAVPNLIPIGLTFLAGRPKVGKSWLALQVAHAIGTGGKLLDWDVEAGRVLYIALEDSPRRIQKRLKLQQVPESADITFVFEWKSLIAGGLADLQTKVETGGFHLVIIDTFSRALGWGLGADQNDVGDMTAVLGNLQRIALTYDLAILLVDHHRKNSTFEDPVDDILGSTSKSAVADCVLGLFRARGRHGTTLKFTGRDIEEGELALRWDPEYCQWILLGEVGQVVQDTLGADVLKAIEELTTMGELATTRRIAKHLDKRESHVSRALAELIKMGKVKRGERQGREVPYALNE